MMRNAWAVFIFAVLFWPSAAARLLASPCQGHGGTVRYHGGTPICADGSVDKHAMRRPAAAKRASARVKVVHFKPATERGQIVNAGDRPPETTLRDSK